MTKFTLFGKRKKTSASTNNIYVEFKEIYNKYWEIVYAICLNNIGNIEVSQGITQEIFLSLWERKDKLEIRNIKGYLIRSAKLKVFEYYRSQEIKSRNLKELASNSSLSSNTTENDVDALWLAQEVKELLNQLPEKSQKIFKMSREDGLSNKKIAEIQNVTERTIEYHISKVLQHLKSNLSSHEFNLKRKN